MCRQLIKSLILLLTLFVAAVNVTLGGDSLVIETTIQPDKKSKQIGYIADMTILSDGRIATADSKLGVSSVVTKDSLETVSYSGKDKAFSSDRISGIASWPDGQYAMSNMSESKIAVFNKSGDLSYAFGSNGSNDGSFKSPRVIAVGPSGRLYVADSGNKRVSVFSKGGVYLFSMGNSKEAEYKLGDPVVIRVDNLERVYVLEQQPNSRVSIFNYRGKLLKHMGAKEFKSVLQDKVGLRSMAVDAHGYLYLGDGNSGKIYIVNWQTDELLSVFGSKGTGPGRFEKLSSLLALPGNKLAVADSGDKKIEIYKIALQGKKLGRPPLLDSVAVASLESMDCDQAYRLGSTRTICLTEDKPPVVVMDGKETTFAEPIDEPLAFAAAEDGYFVLDDDFTIKGYEQSGKHLYTIGKRGKREGEFRDPRDIAYSNGQIYVADTGNNRVQIFSKQGVALGNIYRSDSDAAIFDEPVAVAADSKDSIYVADDGARKIKVFSAEKELLYTIDSADGIAFSKFYDMGVDIDDKLYVLAAVKNNNAGIYVFQEGKQVFRFGSAGKYGNEIYKPNALAISLNAESWVSVYSQESKRLNTYQFEQVPAVAAGLNVEGGINRSVVSWRVGGSKIVARYRLYSSLFEGDGYKLLKELAADKSTFSHQHNDSAVPRYYRITAVSGFGIESYRSEAVPDEFRQSINHYRKGKFDQALRGFERLSVLSPRNAESKKYYGLSLSALEKYDAAARVFSALAKLPGYESEGINLQISALAASGNSVDASALVFDAITQGVATLDTLVTCGHIGLELDDAITAIDCLEQALEVSPDHLETHLLLGRAYLNLNIPDQALTEFDIALSIAPENASIWYETGLAYKQMGQQSEATTHFENTLEREPNFTAARLELVEAYFETGQIDKVNALAVKLAGEKSTKAYGQYLLGQVAVHKGNDTRAILAFTRSTREDKKNVDAWVALANLYQTQGNDKKTYAILRQAEKFNPDSGHVAEKLGVYHYTKGEHKDAIPYLSRATEVDAENAVTQLMLAESFHAAGNVKSAIKHATISLLLDEEQNPLRMLLASLYSSQGKNSKAIEYIKDAIEREPDNDEYYVRLGETYTEFNFYDDAIVALDKAMVLMPTSTSAMLALGKLYSKRRMFEKAISAFQQVNNIEPTDLHQSLLDEAHASFTKAREFSSNAPRVALSDLQFERVFSATYKQYAEKSLGHITIENLSGTDYGGMKLRMNVKGYMDFPWIQEVPLLEANSSQEISLYASFNNKILEIDEDTGVQVELSLDYVRDGQQDSIVVTQPMTIYGKNAILWRESNMVGSFVTPKDSALHEFVRPAMNASTIPNKLVNKKLLTAMTLFEILSAHGIRYIPDPTSPYSTLNQDRVDYVQFSRETLRLKSGDCDDLVVLFSAGLENLGIETAVLDIPGHLFFMLNTGLPSLDRDKITSDDQLLAIHNGTIWIPVDATMIATSFAEAWTEGARKYRQNFVNETINIIEMHDAWSDFRPVTLKPQKNTMALPDQKILSYSIAQENNFLLEKSVARLTRPYNAILANDPLNSRAKMQIAIYYAKYGLDEKAHEAFDELLILEPENSAIYNNRGNIYFGNLEFDLALNSYSEAEALDPADPKIRVNQAMTYYRLGDLDMAKGKFDEAVALSADISEQYENLSKLITK